MDWSVVDPIILQKAIASEDALFCYHCQNVLHSSTGACPFSLVSLGPPAPNPKSDITNNKPPWQKVRAWRIMACSNIGKLAAI